MRWRRWLLSGALLVLPFGVMAGEAAGEITRVAFGSCNKHDLPQPLWRPIIAWKPQVWIWLGDSIYGDTTDMAVLAAKWRAQKAQPDYARLRTSGIKVLGIWDDHDYGANNAGRAYPRKRESQALLLDFLDEPVGSARRAREGIYDVVRLGVPGRDVNIILLDGRTFRDAPGPDGDLLGAEQWRWLEHTLADSPARLTLIASGSQVLPREHAYEKWADYPKSRERLLALLDRARLPAVVFLSGDRHFGEISRLDQGGGISLLEVTSSGMTHVTKRNPSQEPNSLRVGTAQARLNFGTLEIDWQRGLLTAALRGEAGEVLEQTTVPLPK